MPLRDHFRPPVWTTASWEGFHGMWPGCIVARLNEYLPGEFSAEPRVHLGTFYEIDVCAFEHDEHQSPPARAAEESAASTAVAAWSAPAPTAVAEIEPIAEYEYEVLVFDHSRGRQLVAAVEIVSPANKDRPKSRQTFVAKCASLLKKGVCVSIVDLVTVRNFNLYGELLEFLEQGGDGFTPTAPATYAATCRTLHRDDRPRFEQGAYPMQVGEPLPTLPLWLSEDLSVPLELEAGYEDACRALRIP